MEVQPQLNQLTQFWLSHLSQMYQLNGAASLQSNDIENSNNTINTDHNNPTNINATNENDRDDACSQTKFNITQLASLFNQNNENFLTALLKKGTIANQSATQSATQKQQQNALVPPTPPRTPITPSAQHQQVSAYFFFSLFMCVFFALFYISTVFRMKFNVRFTFTHETRLLVCLSRFGKHL